MTGTRERIESFDLRPGRLIGGKYVVQQRLGGGWEGEVYKVVEERTGAHRAMKIFFPHRNEGDRCRPDQIPAADPASELNIRHSRTSTQSQYRAKPRLTGPGTPGPRPAGGSRGPR